MDVAMIDLLTQTPFYDRDLAESIAPLVDRFTAYMPRFHYEPDYFDGVAFDRTPGLVEWVSGLRIKNPFLRRTARLFEYALNWQYLLFKFRRQPPDLVHVQWLPLLSWTEWEIHKVERLQQLGIKTIYTVHNYRPRRMSPQMWPRYQRVYKTFDHLIVHTHSDRTHLLHDPGIPAEKVSVIPHGPLFAGQANVDRVQARLALGLQPHEIAFLMLGRLRPYKGLEETLLALSQVVKIYPQCKLIIAGQTLDRSYQLKILSLATELNLQSHVQWHLRYIHSSEVGRFHAAADIVLFPYREISQSGAFLTAAALGSCTLSTRIGGLAEIVQDGRTGLQIDAVDPATLAAGLKRCIELTAEERRRMGQALQQYVQHHCHWDLVARKVLNTYHRAMRG